MKLSRRVSLSGNQLDQVNTAVVIRSADPGTPHESYSAVNRMGGSGQEMTGQHWEYLEASVSYAIDLPKKQLAARRNVFDAVNAWALQKGWLRMNFMQNKRMRVDKVILPDSGDLFDWNAEFKITFRAYGVPFWQDDTATQAEIGASDENSGEITVPGQMGTVCDANITNVSGSTINTMSVKVGSSKLEFTNLGLADDEELQIGHDNSGKLTIMICNGGAHWRSVYDKRTGGADDLYVKPGDREITITGGAVTAVISCYGRYV